MTKFPLTTDELVDMIGVMSLGLQDVYDTCQAIIDKYNGGWEHEDLSLAVKIQERIDKIEL